MKGKYQASFDAFRELLSFDCTKPENRIRLTALPDDDIVAIIYETTQNMLLKTDDDPNEWKEKLKAIMDTIDWLIEARCEPVNEQNRLAYCIKYTGVYAAKFIQSGLAKINDPSEFEDYWGHYQRFASLDAWTIRIMIKSHGEEAMPASVAPCDAAEFFEAVYPSENIEKFSQEERTKLFQMFTKRVFQDNTHALCSVYEYMLQHHIAFSKFMDRQTSLELIRILANSRKFSVEYEDELRSMVLTDEEFQDYQRKKAEAIQQKKELDHLLKVQDLLKSHVWGIVNTPQEFLNCAWKTEFKEIFADSFVFLKQMYINFGEHREPILEELFHGIMRENDGNLCRYVERMNNIANTARDSYFLEVMAKCVLKEINKKSMTHD